MKPINKIVSSYHGCDVYNKECHIFLNNGIKIVFNSLITFDIYPLSRYARQFRSALWL